MKIVPALLAAATSLLVVSCCACRKGSPKIGDLENAKWELIEFDNKAVSGAPITLVFDGAKKMIYGTAPCNNFFGGYSLFEKTEDNIKISSVGSTRKYCPDAELETAFTGRLSEITRIKMEGQNMLMMDSQGKLIAVFRVAGR